MRGGRLIRSRKTAAKEEPIVRVAPTPPKPVARIKPAPVARIKPAPPKPVARIKPKPAASKRPTAPKIPESVQKRIEEMIASGRMKAPAPKKPVPKKTVAKKAAPKSAISRGRRTGDKIIAGLASSRRGKTVKGNPFLMGKSKAAPKKTVAKKKPVEPKLPEGERTGG